MPRKTIIIISILFSILIIGLFAGAYIITQEEGGPVGEALRDALPFGRAPDTGREPPEVGEQPDTPEFPSGGDIVDEAELPQLRKLSDAPVAGFVASSTATTTVVRYMERETGHTYEFALNRTEARRLTNTTIPGVHRAFWNKDGTAVIARYLDEDGVVKSFLGILSIATSTINEEGEQQIGTLTGSFLEDDIASLVLSPEKDAYFSLKRTGSTMLGARALFEADSTATRLLDSSFAGWSASWNYAGAITLYPRPSAETPGYAYLLDAESGNLERVVGNIDGLTARLSPNGERLLYSEATGDGVETHLFSVPQGEHMRTVAQTLPEKCTWSVTGSVYCGVPEQLPTGNYPDDWYQGHVLFSDYIEVFDAEGGALLGQYRLDELSNEASEVDVINPAVSDNGDYLVFQNKRDGSLWSLRLE